MLLKRVQSIKNYFKVGTIFLGGLALRNSICFNKWGKPDDNAVLLPP
jgi:hypothetical protein